MGKARLDLANPPRLRPEQRAAHDALTQADIERNAESDLDNPPMTDAELDLVRAARAVQAVREARGMSQTLFAETYGIAVTRLRDWARGRFKPDAMAWAYRETIRHEPEAVARALEKAGTARR